MSTKFSSPPDLHGFYIQVWNMVRQIPPGKVATYGQIARLVGPPVGVNMDYFAAFGARWVGGAMAACPEGIPWQRVVNAQGKISLNRSGGYSEQHRLLEEEGIVFDDRERIDLKRFGWEGPTT